MRAKTSPLLWLTNTRRWQVNYFAVIRVGGGTASSEGLSYM